MAGANLYFVRGGVRYTPAARRSRQEPLVVGRRPCRQFRCRTPRRADRPGRLGHAGQGKPLFPRRLTSPPLQLTAVGSRQRPRRATLPRPRARPAQPPLSSFLPIKYINTISFIAINLFNVLNFYQCIPEHSQVPPVPAWLVASRWLKGSQPAHLPLQERAAVKEGNVGTNWDGPLRAFSACDKAGFRNSAV